MLSHRGYVSYLIGASVLYTSRIREITVIAWLTRTYATQYLPFRCNDIPVRLVLHSNISNSISASHHWGVIAICSSFRKSKIKVSRYTVRTYLRRSCRIVRSLYRKVVKGRCTIRRNIQWQTVQRSCMGIWYFVLTQPMSHCLVTIRAFQVIIGNRGTYNVNFVNIYKIQEAFPKPV